MQIRAGLVEEICKKSGEWMIVDVGFSRAEASCGVWSSADKAPKEVEYGCLTALVIQEARKKDSPALNLLLEAPLSVAFNKNDNPDHRRCDEHKGKWRDWYVNAGAVTLVAVAYLLRALSDCERQREVRLFEGLVSFKSPNAKSSNTADVLALKKVVWGESKGYRVFNAEELKYNNNSIVSAFAFAKMDFGIPPVIRVDPSS